MSRSSLSLGAITTFALGSVLTGLTQQITDVLLLGEGWSWGELAVGIGFAGLMTYVGARWIKPNFGSRLLTTLFPTSGRSGSWNSFQTFASRMPILRNLDNTLRGYLWREVVQDEITDLPEAALTEVLEEYVVDDVVDMVGGDGSS